MRRTSRASLRFSSWVDDLLRDDASPARARRRSASSARQRLHDRRAGWVAVDGQDRVARPRRPGGGGHGELGGVGRVEDHVVRRLARARPRRSGRSRRALERVVALDQGGLVAGRPGHVGADADHLGVLREVGALGLQPLEHVLGHGGQVAAVGEQDRRADRAARRARTPRPPSPSRPGPRARPRWGGRGRRWPGRARPPRRRRPRPRRCRRRGWCCGSRSRGSRASLRPARRWPPRRAVAGATRSSSGCSREQRREGEEEGGNGAIRGGL